MSAPDSHSKKPTCVTGVLMPLKPDTIRKLENNGADSISRSKTTSDPSVSNYIVFIISTFRL